MYDKLKNTMLKIFVKGLKFNQRKAIHKNNTKKTINRKNVIQKSPPTFYSIMTCVGVCVFVEKFLCCFVRQCTECIASVCLEIETPPLRLSLHAFCQ